MKKTVRILALFLCAAVFLLSACEQSGISPSSDYYVYDDVGVLENETRQYIVEKNRRLASLTGAQIVVACVKTTGDEEIDDFATRIFNAWGIGDEKENNGVLLLLSIEEEDYWVLQGKGLEDILSSGILKLMLREHMEPYFAAGEYDKGVHETFDAILQHLESAYSIVIAEGEAAENWETDAGEDMYSPEQTPVEQEQSVLSALVRLFRRAFVYLAYIFAGLPFLTVVVIVIVIILLSRSSRRQRPAGAPPHSKVNRSPYSSTTRVHFRPGAGPGGFYPPPPGGFGGFGGFRGAGGRPGHFGGGPRPGAGSGFGGANRTGGFGSSSRPGRSGGATGASGGFGSSGHHGGFGGSRGGGGHSRGGGAGRR